MCYAMRPGKVKDGCHHPDMSVHGANVTNTRVDVQGRRSVSAPASGCAISTMPVDMGCSNVVL
jgi:hypothetical protein